MAKKTKKKAAVKAKKKPVKKAKKAASKAKPKKAAAKAKAAPKKSAAKKSAAKKKASGHEPILEWRIPKPGESRVGIVDDFFSHVGVITLTLTAPLSVGDKIHVRGHTTDLEEAVNSMQCEHKSVEKGTVGMGIGIKISDKARRGDYVYKIKDEE